MIRPPHKILRTILVIFFAAACGTLLAVRLMHRGSRIKNGYNIVLITIDALRADHLGCYGYQKGTSAFLDTLAYNGVVFQNAFSVSSWTAPSTASMFTSLYPFQHGVVTGIAATERLQKKRYKMELNSIPREATTIAECLKRNGYRTFAVTDNHNICRAEGFDQGFDKFENYNYRTAEAVNAALKKWKKEIVSRGPYFLYIHYNDPHSPYHKRSPWFKEQGSELLNKISAYDSEIGYVDDKIKEMFDLFGWDNHALVIITSDHGEEFLEHGGWMHGSTLYNELLHVPLIVYLPGKAYGPRKIETNVSILDIAPTVIELAGIPSRGEGEGKSLVPFLEDRAPAAEERYLFGHLSRKMDEYGKDVLKRSVVHGDWKYIVTSPSREEVFNLKDDPGEQANRIAAARTIAERLKAALYDFEKNCKKNKQRKIGLYLNRKTLEKLKSLGYLQ